MAPVAQTHELICQQLLVWVGHASTFVVLGEMMDIGKFNDKVYQTYLARVQGSKRIGARAHTWSLATVVASVSLTFLSIFTLQSAGPTNIYGLTALSVAVLVLSTWGAALKHSARERDMVHAYLRIQEISDALYLDVPEEKYVRRGNCKSRALVRTEVDRLWMEYRSILNSCENHTTADFWVSRRGQYVQEQKRAMAEAGGKSAHSIWRAGIIQFRAWLLNGPVVTFFSGVGTALPLVSAVSIAVWVALQVIL